MNEDILLTNKSPEIVKIVQEYWGAPIILDQDDLEIIVEEACQAQLLKVVEWVKKNNCAPLQAEGARTYAAHLVLPKEAWQAFKQAAGEGK